MTNQFYGHLFGDDLDAAPFDTEDYSCLKFGSDRVARAFGRELADAFFRQHLAFLSSHQCVVIPAPSSTVPVAATLLGKHFRDRLNDLLSRVGVGPVEWNEIHRDMHYNNNYSELPKEERQKLLTDKGRFVNRDYLVGKALIFIDDVSITGTHEDKLVHLMKVKRMNNPHMFVAYGKYTGEDASIEHRLNHRKIQTANDLATLAHERGHRCTTRSLRLFIEASESQMKWMLKTAPRRFLEDVYHSCIVKGYNVHEPYIENFILLRAQLDRPTSALDCPPLEAARPVSIPALA